VRIRRRLITGRERLTDDGHEAAEHLAPLVHWAFERIHG